MYGTIDAWLTYATERGQEDVAARSPTEQSAALYRASDYIKTRYVNRLSPKYDSSLPEVEQATYEAALIELLTPGFFRRTYVPGQAKTMVQADSIRWELVKGSSSKVMVPVLTIVEDMFAPFVVPDTGESSGLWAING